MSNLKNLMLSGKGLAFLAILAALGLGIAIGPIISEQVLSFQDVQKVSLLKVDSDVRSSASGDAAALSKGFREVATGFEPYVVNIRSRTVPRRARRDSDEEPRSLLERFFGQQPPRVERHLGSGTIVDEKGYIITNSHVVTVADRRRGRREADRIEVMLHNGKTYKAEVLGFDEVVDIAVLKINAEKDLPSANIGETSKMRIGDWVLAIGSPFGLEQTVTAGIISAKGRPGDRFGAQANLFGDYLQTDAAINPGNSGGPLVNMAGQLVGINTFISTRSGGSQGIGFAIPSHVFVNAYNQLVRQGRIERGWIGISMNQTPMTPEMAEYFGVAGDDPQGVKDGDGVIITELIGETPEDDPSTGPASKAGLKAEDVVVKIGEREIESPFDLRSAVATTPPGEELDVTVVRDGRVKTYTVELARRTLEDRPREQGGARSFEERPEPRERPKEIGLVFETVDESDAQRLDLGEDEGRVVITEVVPGSLADDAGLDAGQVISKVNGEIVENADEFYEIVSGLGSGEAAILRVIQPIPNGATATFYTSFVKP